MKQEELRDKFNLEVLPASVQLEDGTWKELFNREQYNEVIDYLFAIGFIDGMLNAERKAERERVLEEVVDIVNELKMIESEPISVGEPRVWNSALKQVVYKIQKNI